MSIDWAKAEEKPEKKLSVEGRILLDLRSKINSLEKQLAQKTKELDRTSNDFITAKEKLSETSKKFEDTNKQFMEVKKNYERVKEEKLYADAEINKFKSGKADLEKKLSETNSKVVELENKLKESSVKVENIEKDQSGIKTKLEAAEIAMKSGIPLVIANSRREDIILDILKDDFVGTYFQPSQTKMSSIERWIAYGAGSKGQIKVNEGATKAIKRYSSPGK